MYFSERTIIELARRSCFCNFMFLVFFFDTLFHLIGSKFLQSLFVCIDCQALATLKKWWGFLQDLEKAMLYNQSLLDAWKFFYFPDQTWVKTNLPRLSEVDFKKTPDRATEAISNKVGGVMTWWQLSLEMARCVDARIIIQRVRWATLRSGTS